MIKKMKDNLKYKIR